ncbi:MAG: metallopeptidase TldD-related protein [Kofleriaceae bacterium]
MTWNRREVLAGLGIAGAHLLAFGCGSPPPVARPRYEVSGEIRSWLREAVELMSGGRNGDTTGTALAVSRRHTAAAEDVLGAGVGHARADGVVLRYWTGAGGVRPFEQATSELSRDGVMNAARILVKGSPAPRRVDFGPPPQPAPTPKPDPDQLDDAMYLQRLAAVDKRETGLSSRIVYAANLLEVDDAMVWFVGPRRDYEQRLFRVRRKLTRVAWNGTRPIISEVSRAWRGGLDDEQFSDDDLAYAREIALSLMTPGSFDDGEYEVVLAPDVVAALVDAAARTVYSLRSIDLPEVTARVTSGLIASPSVTIVDDPTKAHAYGSFEFDDEGEVASPIGIVDRGKFTKPLHRVRRPGHSGPAETPPSHLVVSPGTISSALVPQRGFRLEGDRGVSIDPASDRCVIAAQRAVEFDKGQRTGRQFTDIELVGTLSGLLGTFGDATSATKSIGIRDDRDGLPCWRSVDAPAIRAKGTLRARRRPA